ncbi:cilia- and flagella-associated protein 65 [Cololabis saira]|uniref:cilia- and flagella-associated protein 65 n=1 Tax=Cololabis saira TaxID=129043 RepID=UPI002AD4E8D7|nr:cilia- and flagella-associated protein 65 [Cololabis saira]
MFTFCDKVQPSVALYRTKQNSRNQHRQYGGKCQRQGQRICFFGLETRPELLWEDWDPGKDFTKTLVLKNIHNNLKKLNIRFPVSNLFSLLSPQKVVISPGTSFSIPVTFRPLQRCEYEDSIEFQSENGSFQVCLRAIVPCHILEVPDSVTLPICAVQDCSQTDFLLKNVSKLPTAFQWDCAAPFQLSPEAGMLKPGKECHIRVVFQPQTELVYQQQVYCRYGEEGDKTDSCCGVLLKGLAKYPYLEFRNHSGKKEGNHCTAPVLQFGSVAVGQHLCKHFDIFNPSPVDVSFSLSRLPEMVPVFGSEFSCDVTRGKVAPGRSLRASVTYSPTVVDTVSVDYLALKYKGALEETQLKLTGTCTGAIVCLSSSLVDFGCVKEGGSVVQTLDLINSSPVEAVYQWDIDCGNSVFHILPVSGIVLAHSQTKLRAIYKPTQSMAHHRRVACLVLHRDPVFLNLIGTCHTENHKPAILKPKQLVLHELHRYPRQQSPNSVSALQHCHNTHLDQQGALSTMEELNQTPNSAAVMSTRPMDEFCQTSMECMDSFSKSPSSPLVSVVPSMLLFNHKIATSFTSSSACSQSVTLTNNSRLKLSLVWTISPNSPFAVSPAFSDLAPLKSTSFQVTYGPKQVNTLHGGQLECFAYYKGDLGEQLMCPPWCVTIRVIGHSFQPGKEQSIPRCSLKPHQVAFPALGVISYRTVLLQNDGDLPLTFYHRKDHNSTESVHVEPACGFIQAGDHQILTLRAVPSEDSPKQGVNLFLQLNAGQFKKELTVVSVAEKPCVSLENGSSLFFHPTAVGSETQLTRHIRNLSRFSIRFQWNIPEQDQELISVKPDGGELHPNDCSIQMWSFHPLAEKTYTIKPTLTFWPVQSDGSNKTHLTLEVFGTGSKGSLEAERAVLDVGEILVGSYQTVEVALVNRSPCPVSFHLSVQQMLTDNQIYDSEAEQCDLKLDCERGTIPSGSKMLLQTTCRPGRQAQYLWTISYQTVNSRGLVSCPPQALCKVQAKGVFPTLQVIDACCGDSVGMLSKVQLWNLFPLDSLNQHLLSTPSPAELTFQTPMRHSLNSCPSIFTMLDFNFSSAPLHSDPSDFVLMFHNPRSIPVDWAFLFPKDQQIELEYWAVTGEYSSTELDHMKLLDSHVFSVSPRAGTLLPGHKRAVNFSYRHDFAGTDRLPVVFKLSYGREILLNFQGVTIERNEPYLHFASTRHVFSSVAIGDDNPPRQMFELHNGGEVPVHYEVDAAALSQLQENNFNHPVLCCLNPEGDILPGKTAVLEWIFSPLEARLYHMDVPIHIQDTNSTLMRFEGYGLDTSMQASSSPFTYSDFKAWGYQVQRTPFQGQVLFLSEDNIFLGNIFVSSQSSRNLFLTNVSQADTAHYVWELPLQGNQQVVRIHPEHGCLRPGECVLCVVTFTPTDYPTIYQLDLICQVSLEASLDRYHNTLRNWEEAQERQENEFIITDKNVPERQKVSTDKEPLASPAKKGPPLRKYKTLPPISASCGWEPVGSLHAKQRKAEHQLHRGKAKVWRRPDPPKPALLHLSVSARTQKLPENLIRCPDRCQRLIKTQQPVKSSAGTYPPPISAHGPVREITGNILTSLLRNILDDSAFIQSLVTLACKPKIYQPTQLSTDHVLSAPPPSCVPTCVTSSSSTIPQSHIRLDGTMDRDRAAGCLENTFQTQSPEHVPADSSEAVLLNTLQNVMMEAVRGELVLTSHPCSVILPPLSQR